MIDQQLGLFPGEHPEYSLDFAFSLLLEVLHIPEIGLHLLEVHDSYNSERVLEDYSRSVCSGLF